MRASDIDAAHLTLAPKKLRLPAIEALRSRFAGQADKGGWPAARLLGALVEHEVAERGRCRIERHLAETRLLPGKTLHTFDLAAVHMVSKAHVSAITAGDSWIGKGNSSLLFGPPRVGKSHLASAIGQSSSAPPISSRRCNRRVATSHSKGPLPSSTSSTC